MHRFQLHQYVRFLGFVPDATLVEMHTPVDLVRMLAVGDYQLADRDVKALESLTRGKQGAFVNWLSRVRSELNGKKSTPR